MSSVTEDIIRTLRDLDHSISQALASFKNYRETFKWIEWSLHGIPWIAGSSLLLITAYGRRWDETVQHRLAVLTTGLIVDALATGLIKMTFQRQRPEDNHNDMIYETPIADQFSFPSGHTSRAAMLATFWCSIYPKHSIFVPILPMTVAISRVMMGRHFISDVLAGLFFGYLQGKIFLTLPMSYNRWLAKVLY